MGWLITDCFRAQTGMRRLLDFLSQNELPLILALQLSRRYGLEALERVRENPYLLGAIPCSASICSRIRSTRLAM